MNLGNAIKFVRMNRNLSRIELASRAKISVSYLSLLERNMRDPNISTVEAIADALNISMIVLTYLASNKEENARIPEEVQEKLAMEALR